MWKIGYTTVNESYISLLPMTFSRAEDAEFIKDALSKTLVNDHCVADYWVVLLPR